MLLRGSTLTVGVSFGPALMGAPDDMPVHFKDLGKPTRAHAAKGQNIRNKPAQSEVEIGFSTFKALKSQASVSAREARQSSKI
ncbi:MAG: hypothetical protein AAGA53_02790 [Pseudomonadota bacterium]